MADQLGQAVLTLTVDDQQFNAGLNKAKSAAEGAGAALRSALGSLGVATTTAGVTAFIGQQVTQLDAAAAAVRTLGVDSQELVARLRALSVELGNNISTVELTKAAYDVASSGFASASDATQILRSAALGAKGGFAEVNDVAYALTGVLNAYGLSAKDAGLLVDQFIQTQADGVITVRQYATEIGNIASIAAASGISIKELNAAIATATLRGVPVAQTFTGLRQAISSIIKPSEQAKELADSLGIQFNVGALKAKGFGGVLADVQAKTGGAADKLAILLGSVEAQAAVQPLLNDKLVKYNELLERQAKASGAAASASETNSKTISGGLKQIGSGFSNLATTLDSTLTPLFSGFIQGLNSILAKLNQVSALAPDKVAARDREAANIVQAAIGPFGGSGFFGAVSVKYKGKVYKGSATGIKEAIVQDLLNAELAKINAPTKASSGAGQGAAEDLQAQQAIQQQQQKLQAALQQELKAKALARRQQQEAEALQQEAEARIALQNVQQRIAYAKQLAAAEAGVVRETIRQRQEIEAGVQAAKDQVTLIGAQIDALRLQGKDKGVDLQKLVDQQNVAAEEVRLKLIEGATALKDAGKQLAQDLKNAKLELASLQSSPTGLNKYLSPQLADQRSQKALDAIMPEFRDAQRTFTSLTGAAAPEFRGRPSDVVASVNQFIKDVDAEFNAGKKVSNTQQALVDATDGLKSINERLATVTEQLAAKNWQVNVNVPGGTASGDVLGPVNAGF